MNALPSALVAAAADLRDSVDTLRFALPVAYTYNPLRYAWRPHETYLRRFGAGRKRALFLGMNPGPWGMAQTGVPFGEVEAVKRWMGIEEPTEIPFPEHPKRPIKGFACNKSEVSGRRLWGLFSQKHPDPGTFFAEHFVLNYCPLVFMEESARNRTPDKLPKAESKPLFEACDTHLRRCIELLQPDWVVGVGAFARKRAERATKGMELRYATVLHPSPASPAANRGWSEAAERQLVEQGLWKG